MTRGAPGKPLSVGTRSHGLCTAARLIAAGRVIAYPVEPVAGPGRDRLDADALRRLLAIQRVIGSA